MKFSIIAINKIVETCLTFRSWKINLDNFIGGATSVYFNIFPKIYFNIFPKKAIRLIQEIYKKAFMQENARWRT